MKNAGSTLIQAPRQCAGKFGRCALVFRPSADAIALAALSGMGPALWRSASAETSLGGKRGNWTVKLNLNPSALGPVGIELQVGDRGIEGQIAANDVNVRQLLGDSMPRLRQSLEALVGKVPG